MRAHQLVMVMASLVMLVLISHAAVQFRGAAAQPPEKIGAGLMLCSDGKALMLKRDSNYNDNKWAFPGGNQEDSDSSLLATATREAREELGQVPPFEIKAQILTKRGKRKQKHFTIFVTEVSPRVSLGFVPQLSDGEHKAWRWVSWADIQESAVKADSDDEYEEPTGNSDSFVVHPIVVALVQGHSKEVCRSSSCCGVQ